MKPLQLSDFTVDPENENIHYATFSNEGFIIEVELVHENWILIKSLSYVLLYLKILIN